jgi:glycosyltransferase involved in cell wall biosynthesis
MPSGPDRIALLYDDDAYVETLQPPAKAPAGAPVGLMGRQVAGKEFLDAYLKHGRWTELVALVRDRRSAESLRRLWQTHPATRTAKRPLRVVEEQHFHKTLFPAPPAPLLYLPGPPDPRFAWARQQGGPGALALCGVTYTICSAAVLHNLCSLVTAPFEPYDALICISRAAVGVVRTVTSTYADYLRDRHGGNPGLPVRLEMIPLGVDTEKFRPATGDERAAQRRALKITDEEVVVLFVGRLSFHAKAHPFPMFAGLAEAARATGQKVHLILSGWAANPSIMNAFVDGARTFAAGVRLSVVDSLKPEARFTIWRVADLFTSLADNLQETFGLTLIQAMACGLPVVASDWDGYRDLVVDGETGYLVPTYMVRDATRATTARLILGELNYDHFLAECTQSAVVDGAAAAAAYARLIRDAALRRRMGAAGRQRVLDLFAWPRVIQSYEELWRGQEAERQAWLARRGTAPPAGRGPACYPAPEDSFAGYPTRLLREGDALAAVGGAERRLPRLLSMPLTSYEATGRTTDATIIRTILIAAATPCLLGQLDALFRQAGVGHSAGRATLGWMLKYGLLRVAQEQGSAQEATCHDSALP